MKKNKKKKKEGGGERLRLRMGSIRVFVLLPFAFRGPPGTRIPEEVCMYLFVIFMY